MSTPVPEEVREARDGTEYPFIPLKGEDITVPVSVELDSADYLNKHELQEGFEIHHMYVKCSEVQETRMPLDANPREPSESRQVKAMQRTLDTDPRDFVKMNNGVVIICSDIDSADGSVSLEFNKGEGICNGGHTYFAVTTANDISDEAKLHLEVIVVPEKPQEERLKDIVDIARARNNSNQLEKRSEADFLGYYDVFRARTEKEGQVEWHENDSDAFDDGSTIDAVHFLRLMKSLDITSYKHDVYNPDANSHKSLGTSKSRVHRQWINQVEKALDGDIEYRPLRYLYPLCNDVLYIRDLLSYSFRQDSDISLGNFRNYKLYKEYVLGDPDDPKTRPLHVGDFDVHQGIDLTATLEVMFLGLFRNNLFSLPEPDNSHSSYVGWILDPNKLWKRRGPQALESMGALYSDLDKDPKQFIRINAPYAQDLYEFGMSKEVPAPEILYELGSNMDEDYTRYKQTDNLDEATHWLANRENEDPGLRQIEESDPPGNAVGYEPSRADYLAD
jgi:hypothetical protein